MKRRLRVTHVVEFVLACIMLFTACNPVGSEGVSRQPVTDADPYGEASSAPAASEAESAADTSDDVDSIYSQKTAEAVFAVRQGETPLIIEPEGLNDFFDYANIPEESKELGKAKITYIGETIEGLNPQFAYAVSVFGRWDRESDRWDFESLSGDLFEKMVQWFIDMGLRVVTNYEHCNYYSRCLSSDGKPEVLYTTDFVLIGEEEHVRTCFKYQKPIHDWYFRVYPAFPETLSTVRVSADLIPCRRLLQREKGKEDIIPISVITTGLVYRESNTHVELERHQLDLFEDVFEAGCFADQPVYLSSDEAEQFPDTLYAFTIQVGDDTSDNGAPLCYSELKKWVSSQGLLLLDGYDACDYYFALKEGRDVIPGSGRYPYADMVVAGTMDQIKQTFAPDAPPYLGHFFRVHPAMNARNARNCY